MMKIKQKVLKNIVSKVGRQLIESDSIDYVTKSTTVAFLMAILMFTVFWFCYVYFFGDLRFIKVLPKDHWLVTFSKHLGVLWFLIPPLIKFGLIVPMGIMFICANNIFKLGNTKALVQSSSLLIILFYVSSVLIELFLVNFIDMKVPLSFDYNSFKEFLIRLHSYDIPFFAAIGVLVAFLKFKVKYLFEKG